MKRQQLLIAGILVMLLGSSPRAEGVLMSWSPRDLEGMTEQRWNAAKEQSVMNVLKANKKVETWPEAYLCLLGANQHKDDAVLRKGLVEQLSDRSERRLTGTHRLIVWERISAGDVLFEGEGLQIEDDVFTVAGRSNWILRTITKKNFGYVKPNTPSESLRALQEKWTRWLAGDDVQEYINPYASRAEGLEEIRSPAAVEALILSLRSNSDKDQKTTECLRNLYRLDKLPSEPGAPGRLCNPDAWAYTYLAKVTDVTDQHDPTWWAKWWDQNKAALTWDADTARFITRKADAKPD